MLRVIGCLAGHPAAVLWRARGLAALLVPEIVYDTFIQAVFVKSAVGVLLRRGSDWHYVPRVS